MKSIFIIIGLFLGLFSNELILFINKNCYSLSKYYNSSYVQNSLALFQFYILDHLLFIYVILYIFTFLMLSENSSLIHFNLATDSSSGGDLSTPSSASSGVTTHPASTSSVPVNENLATNPSTGQSGTQSQNTTQPTTQRHVTGYDLLNKSINVLVNTGTGAAAYKITKEVLKYMPHASTPVKAAVAISTFTALTGGAVAGGEIARAIVNRSSNDGTNIFGFLVESSSKMDFSLDSFPFTLLFPIRLASTSIITLSMVILNINLINYIKKLNLENYLPENKVGNFLKYLILRYYSIWDKSSKFLVIFSTIVILFSGLLIQLCTIIITSYL